MTTTPCPYGPDDQVQFAYGEMNADRAEAFAAHLEDCSACRAAVAELKTAADLCRTVRKAPVPEARWTRDFQPAPPWWKRPLVWSPALAAACALLIWVLFRPAPAPEPPPPARPPEPVQLPVQIDPLPLSVAEVSGDVRVHRSGQAEISRFDKDQRLYPGDSLLTGDGARVILGFQERGRILIDQSSVLRLDAMAADGDRFDLSRGQAGFRVERQEAERPFLVSVDRREVRVLGTVFAVGLKPSRVMLVGVGRGAVEVRTPDKRKILGKVATGRQTFFAPDDKTTRSDRLGPELKKLMAPLMPEAPGPKKQARLDSSPPPEPEPQKAPEPPASRAPQEPARKKDTVDSVETLVENLYQDTGWIFDDLRSQMDRSDWHQVLDKLNNYLADPESPSRDDALMLKAACLEKLSRFKEANGVYRHYLLNWPAGPRAREARQGLLRTQKHR